MHVDVDSSGDSDAPVSTGALKRSRKVPIVTWSPSEMGLSGTGRSLTRTPLVDWLSRRIQTPFSRRR
jgi:hypothetical protein